MASPEMECVILKRWSENRARGDPILDQKYAGHLIQRNSIKSGRGFDYSVLLTRTTGGPGSPKSKHSTFIHMLPSHAACNFTTADCASVAPAVTSKNPR